jgi:hypothetical protein
MYEWRYVCVCFKVQTRDEYDNNVTHGDASMTVDMIGPGSYHANVTDQKNGKYTVDFITFVTGRYVMHVKLDAKDIADSPFKIDIYTDPAWIFTGQGIAVISLGCAVAAGAGMWAYFAHCHKSRTPEGFDPIPATA